MYFIQIKSLIFSSSLIFFSYSFFRRIFSFLYIPNYMISFCFIIVFNSFHYAWSLYMVNFTPLRHWNFIFWECTCYWIRPIKFKGNKRKSYQYMSFVTINNLPIFSFPYSTGVKETVKAVPSLEICEWWERNKLLAMLTKLTWLW